MCRMFLSLVNAVPIGALVVIVVALVVGLTLLGVRLARRLVPATREGFDAEVSSQLLGVVATLFGLLLAFVVVLTFQAYGDTGANERQEAAGIAQIVRDSRAFSPADQAAVSAASAAYVRAVVYDEWPRLREGGSSAAATAAIDGLYRAMQAVRPSNRRGLGVLPGRRRAPQRRHFRPPEPARRCRRRPVGPDRRADRARFGHHPRLHRPCRLAQRRFPRRRCHRDSPGDRLLSRRPHRLQLSVRGQPRDRHGPLPGRGSRPVFPASPVDRWPSARRRTRRGGGPSSRSPRATARRAP